MEHSQSVQTIPKLSITVAEAAEATALSENYLRQLATQGVLPCVRVGRALRFMVSDLEQFLRDHRRD